VAITFVPLAYFILWRTAFGLRLRSAGEAPVAAESLGVNVYAMKYAGVLISGGLAGLGGGFLAIVAASNYQENQVAGRGYIGLAALLFGNYRPGGLLAGAGLFGFADALQLRDSTAIHALLLLSHGGPLGGFKQSIFSVAEYLTGKGIKSRPCTPGATPTRRPARGHAGLAKTGWPS